jgi:UDP-N-acetyl-D-glucosamine dehydrogenase
MKKKINVGVIGLGYVGLPLLLLINKKFNVFGFDKDNHKINMLKKKLSYISDVKNNELKKLDPNIFCYGSEYHKLSLCDYVIICLPTPLKKNIPDMSYIENCFSEIYSNLKKNQTIILESSVYTGATKKIFEKKINKKFKIGKNFFLCYSPERIDPGQDKFNEKTKYVNITKLISGHSKKCLAKIRFLYKSVFKTIYECNSIEVAETAKLLENIYRSVNIGLVNEMKIISHKLNLNIHQVIDAAGSKPFGFRKFSPGPGVGGHCIPIDPVFMSWLAKKNNSESKFINLSVQANKKVTDWTIKNIIQRLKKKSKIILLGLTYKKDVNDMRESPSLKIFKSLILKKYNVKYYDPYVKNVKINNKSYSSISVKDYSKFDNILLLTDHSNFKYNKILKEGKSIIDTRGRYKSSNSPKVIHL